MGRRSGSADLPLHTGQVPTWLAARMARLGRVITEAIVLHHGRQEFLRRLSHPFWFQSFGAVMGMDWHSSGITTSVLGALKRGLAPVQHELGIYVCGGRGRHSRRTPDELAAVAEQTGIDGTRLARTSRLVAKVDSAAIQDGFALYLHGFVVTADGAWTVVQQGMAPARRQARRYHWLSEGLEDFVDAPHSAICGEAIGGMPGAIDGQIINLTDRRAARARAGIVETVHAGPDRALAALRCLEREDLRPRAEPSPPAQPVLPRLSLPAHHEVRAEDLVQRRLRGALAAAAEAGPRDFAELLEVAGVGARTVEALALVSEVIHGAPSRFTDPARFAFAHGGKDGHPFPVPLRVYDRTVQILKEAVRQARLGQDEKLAAIARLDEAARRLERSARGPTFDRLVARERRASPALAGRSVFGPARPPAAPASAASADRPVRSAVPPPARDRPATPAPAGAPRTRGPRSHASPTGSATSAADLRQPCLPGLARR